MFKRILKVVGIVLASFIGIAGAATGIYALAGGFKETEIPITQLFFDDGVEGSKVTSQTIYTLEDISTKLKCEPWNATDQNIEIDYSGDTLGIIENRQESLAVGETLSLKLRKDEHGNNICGPATITFKKGIAKISLKLLVDVAIPDNVLYFTGVNNSSQITSSGNSFTMASSSAQQEIYLKSQLENAFYLPSTQLDGSGDTNLKNPDIYYQYYDSNNILKEEGTLSGKADTPYNALTNKYEGLFKITITPKYEGYIKISSKMHRTYEIEKEYTTNKFDQLETYIETNQLDKAYPMLTAYNDFLNKYIKYFNTTEESNRFFMQYYKNGKIALEANLTDIKGSKEYIFSTCSATIDVTGVYIQGITSTSESRTFSVFNSTNLAVSNVSGVSVEDITRDNWFDIDVELSDDSVANAEFEKKRVLKTLNITPYLFIRTRNADGTPTELIYKDIWVEDPTKDIPVYGFDDNTPITVKPTTAEGEEIEAIGYLYKLEQRVSNLIDYMSITQYGVKGNNYWEMNCNIPLKEDSNETEINKALYLQFSVEGVADLKATKFDTFYDYTRIYIDYNNYFDANSTRQNLEFNDLYKMAINSSLKNAKTVATAGNDDTDVYASSFNTQDISIDTSIVSDYNSKQYKNVMYFVESKSNILVEGEKAKKVLTSGKFKFESIEGTAYNFGGENALIGERIPTYNVVNGKKVYYLQALNASDTPVKVFAVVYLSDENGNPIDTNGKKISITEDADNITLVVIAKTDITSSNMKSVTIDSFVDNINFYTTNPTAYPIIIKATDVGLPEDIQDFNIEIPAGLINRNSDVSTYIPEEYLIYSNEKGVLDKLKAKVQDVIRVKLLKENKFDIFATNFELTGTNSTDASINDALDAKKTFSYKDFYGKDYSMDAVINIRSNKLIAFKYMCSDFKNNFKLSAQGLSVEDKGTIIKSNNEPIMISFTLMATESGMSNNLYITQLNNSSNAIYSSDIEPSSSGKSNWANFKTSQIEIVSYSMTEGLEHEVDLYAKYAKKEGNDFKPGTLTFQEKLSASQFAQYLWKVDEYGFPIGADLTHKVTTNLIVEISDNTETIKKCNLDIIDLSQNIMSSDSGGEPLQNNKYSSIEDYLKKKITIDRVQVAAPSKVISLLSNSTIDGVEYKKDEYFPVIGENQDTVIINDKEYKIGDNQGNPCIYDGVVPIAIKFGATLSNGNAYKPSDYFDSSAIEYTSNGAYLPFLKGESDGVIFYLTLTCSLMKEGEDYAFEKTEVFKFNLKQEDITIKVHNENNEDAFANDMNIIAGQTQKITLGTSSSYSIFTTALRENDFFDHVTFEIANPDSGIAFRLNENGDNLNQIDYTSLDGSLNSFYLYSPVNLNPKSTEITMTYKHKGVVVGPIAFKVNSIPTVAFANKGDVSQGADNKYNITLSDDNTYSVSTLLSNNFEITKANASDTVILKLYEGNSVIENINIPKQVAYRDSVGTIDKNKIEYNMKLSINGQEVDLPNFVVEVNPSMVLDTTKVTNVKVYNNHTLWVDYVELYEGDGYNTLVTDTNVYNIYLGLYQGNNQFSDGKITTAESELSGIILKIGDKVIMNNINIDIILVDVYYTESGEYLPTTNEDRTNIKPANLLTSNINITLSASDSMDITKYVVAYTKEVEDPTIILEMVLVDDSGNVVANSNVQSNKAYRMAYAIKNGLDYDIINILNYKVTFTIV